MNIVELTEFLIKQLINDSDNISLKQFEDDEFITIEVLVSPEVIGRIIGRNGSIINSIRTIVQAAAYVNLNKKVRINIDAF